MIISTEKKYIFVAVPKTGTTSIQRFLLKQDPTARRNTVEIGGEKIRFRDHATAQTIAETLGDDFSQYRVFGFIRAPHARLVSSYHFYKNGRPITPNNSNPLPTRIRIWFARLIPFKVWALLYPYKSNVEFLLDEHGKELVTHIGIFENLGEDLKKILQDLQLDIDMTQLPHTNKSKHRNEEQYFNAAWFRKLLMPKIRQDLEFYQKYSNHSQNSQLAKSH